MAERGNCIILIGMAACGKTTVGRALADALGLVHADSDMMIEAAYGVRLQTVTESMSKDCFLDLEASIVSSLNLRKTVLSTGGSVVYRESAMRHLTSMGVIIHLDTPLPVILERISRKPDRGLAIAPGQTIEDLYAERDALYRKWADYSLKNDGFSLEQTVQAVARWLRSEHPDLCVPGIIS